MKESGKRSLLIFYSTSFFPKRVAMDFLGFIILSLYSAMIVVIGICAYVSYHPRRPKRDPFLPVPGETDKQAHDRDHFYFKRVGMSQTCGVCGIEMIATIFSVPRCNSCRNDPAQGLD